MPPSTSPPDRSGRLEIDPNGLTAQAAPGALFTAVDVHYLDDGGARAAVVATADQQFSQVVLTEIAMVSGIDPYRPGKFYRRELPPLRAVIPTAGELALIVVDGYVDLDPDGRPGLGTHVHDEFGVPVIGVAKTAFQTATHAAQVLRGQSTRPLYVTAAGMTIADAAVLVAEMAGRFRLPDALKRVDQLARGLESPSARPRGLSGSTEEARNQGPDRAVGGTVARAVSAQRALRAATVVAMRGTRMPAGATRVLPRVLDHRVRMLAARPPTMNP